MSSENRFGFEWEKYNQIYKNYLVEFKNWVDPLTPDFFRDKKVLDAGCGMGRNSYWVLTWGAKEVIAFDFGERSVLAAKENLAKFDNAKVVWKSIYDISWQEEFDLVFCIGVLHHLKDPQLALKNLVRSLKKGGTLLVWVYGFEGYEWIVKYVSPVRKNITSKLPLPVVHFLSYFCSIPLWVFVKILKGPTPYLKQMSSFGFWHIHSNVFDQLIPDVANYWKKEEVENLFKKAGLAEFEIHSPPNKCGWTIIGKK